MIDVILLDAANVHFRLNLDDIHKYHSKTESQCQFAALIILVIGLILTGHDKVEFSLHLVLNRH